MPVNYPQMDECIYPKRKSHPEEEWLYVISTPWQKALYPLAVRQRTCHDCQGSFHCQRGSQIERYGRMRLSKTIPIAILHPPLGRKPIQGKRIIDPLYIFINFYQIISLLSHTDFTKLTKTASLKARSCRLCRVFTNRMVSTSVASDLREICVKIKCL